LLIDDIKKMREALEEGIVWTHVSKIKSLNQIIKKVWERTYTGDDIKTIKIECQITETKKNGRNFNYEIMCVKEKD